MDAHDREVYVVEEFVVELDGETCVEEDHHLLLAVLLEECKQKQEATLGRTHHVPL